MCLIHRILYSLASFHLYLLIPYFQLPPLPIHHVLIPLDFLFEEILRIYIVRCHGDCNV